VNQQLGLVTLLVRDYDESLAFFCNRLGFELVEDTPLTDAKRWVVVRPGGDRGAALLLAKAANAEQAASVGAQTGGRVAFFLYTDDFKRDYQALQSRGIRFLEEPRHESYGTVAVFVDLYGNKWDLIEQRTD
jgi:catechol 2,3-dioxygenase-like lactoylglutathione lyase family enzyme